MSKLDITKRIDAAIVLLALRAHGSVRRAAWALGLPPTTYYELLVRVRSRWSPA